MQDIVNARAKKRFQLLSVLLSAKKRARNERICWTLEPMNADLNSASQSGQGVQREDDHSKRNGGDKLLGYLPASSREETRYFLYLRSRS